MRYFSIDEDILNALIDLIQDACIQCQELNDPDTEKFYQYMLGELEHAKLQGTTPDLTPEEESRLKKVERYLRMLQRGLKNPDDDIENKKRRDFARDIMRAEEQSAKEQPQKDKEHKEVENVKPLTEAELKELDFEQYYQEREHRLGRTLTLNKLLKSSGITKNK